MSSKGTPAFDIRETKLCRSCRGVHWLESRPAFCARCAGALRDVGRVDPATERCAEHEAVVDPSVACAIPRFLLGLLMSGQGLDTQGGKAEGVDSTSMLGMLIAINSLLALVVAVALGILTLGVELLLAGGRTTRRLRTSGT
jgi:hypothetical protein